MNYTVDLTHCGVCGSVAEHQSAEAKGLRFDSSWGFRIFLCPTLLTTQKTSLFFYLAQNLPSLLFLSTDFTTVVSIQTCL